MKPIDPPMPDQPSATVYIGRDQPDVATLPAVLLVNENPLIAGKTTRLPDNVPVLVYSRWEFTQEERLAVFNGAPLEVGISKALREPLQPIRMNVFGTGNVSSEGD